MKITELIKRLEEEKQRRGDIECIAFQHEEENERIRNISYFYFDEKENTLLVS